MSNLPVLWVPPVEPPSPEDRPPPPRGRRGLLLAAVAALVVPVAAWALMGGHGTDRAPGPGTSGGSQPYLMSTEDKAAAKPATPLPSAATAPTTSPAAPAASTPSPTPSAPVETAATPPAASTPTPPLAATAPTTTEPTPPAAPTIARGATPETGGDGQGVRVIDMTRPNGGSHAVARPAVSLPDTAREPTTRRPATAATTPSAPAAASPASPAPSSADGTAAAPPASTTPAQPREAAPEKKTAARPTTTPKPATSGPSSSDFADRLATIRRSEEAPPRVLGAPPRYLDVPPSVADEEDTRIVTPSMPRDERYAPRARRDADWDDDGRLPPAGIPGDDPPPRRALRPFDGPDRMVRAGAPRGENCHYHAYPSDDMAFHRDIRCHWHDDPNDPSIHYTR